MVRETRHLWVGNLPDNIREDRIREHFKRYGRVQNVKILARAESASVGASGTSGVCATVAFMDIKSASKAHNGEHVLDERTLTTEYYEPAAIPAAAGAPSAGSSPAGSGYSGSSSSMTSAPAPSSTSRYHLSGGEESSGATTCPIAASAAAPATWRGTNDSATEYCRRGNTPAAYGRTTPHQRWYASSERAGGESTPSTPGGGTESGRRRRLSGSQSSRSDSSSPEPSDTSRASTPHAHPPASHHNNHRTPSALSHQWPSTANGRPLSICVRNLPTRSTDSSLKDGLYHEYKKHGKVVWVKVVGLNAERYAVVRFKKPSDVEKALEVSQDKLFFGCKISVAPHQSCDDDAESTKPYETDIDEYHPKATRTLFIGNLEKDVTQQQLRDKFKHFGRIIEIDIKKGSGGGAGYAFCQYASISSVVEAIRAMDGEYVGGSRVKLGFGKPVATACVWVDGLTEHTEKQVLGAVSRCGAATSVCVDRAAGAALVHFEQACAAGAAVRELRRVAAAASAAEPTHPRLCVDYASRECQDAFYEQLEKHGGSAALAGSERLSGDVTTRYAPSIRHDSIRYEGCGSRSRASSYGRSSSRTPRYSTLEHYDPVDYAADRRYRVYDETGTSPPLDETPFEDRLQSVVMSPHRARRHRRDSSPEDRKHSKERHRSAGGSARRSRSGSAGREKHTTRRKHRRRHDGSASRAGTPVRDEPDAPPAEPRRPPRDRPPLPMCLPLPKFAAQLLRAAPPTPRPTPQPAPAPDSPPRPPSVSSSSGGSAPHSPSLEERIRSLDEKYEKWSGSRALTEAPDRARLRHRLLEVDINEVKPSEVVSALLAKRSVFDEDSERLECVVRAPSPTEGRVRNSAPRLPRYPPLPSHPHPPPPPATHPALHYPTLELDSIDRPSDPRLNRPERPCRLEKLGKINESDYGECRLRPRTPSTDRSQPEPCERKSPSALVDGDTESRSRDSATGTGDAESKSSFDTDDKESLELIIKRERSNSSTSDSLLTGKSDCTTIPLLQTVSEQIAENKSPNSTQLFHLEQKCVGDIMELMLMNVEHSQKAEPLVEKPCKRTDDNKSELSKQSEPSLLDSEPKISICENTKNTEIIKINMFNQSKDTVDFELQLHHKISKNHKDKDISDVNKCDKIDKDRFNHNLSHGFHQHQIAKLEKENIQLEKHHEKEKQVCNINLLVEKKLLDTDKNIEDRVVRNDRDKVRQHKERLPKEKHDSEKDKFKNNRADKYFEKSERDRKSKEDSLERNHLDKIDKIKIEKDLDKNFKDKIDSDRIKHLEEKPRHEHHKKDRSEKDRRKENDSEATHSKSKKDDKHKFDKQKKDVDVKKEIKKESEPIKSRKSSRDESLREISRKDSTDSSTSRASHESTKPKELENHDIKEDMKPRVKLTDMFLKLDADKDANTRDSRLDSSVKIKSEIKEEKFIPMTSKLHDVTESNIKPKAELIEKHRHHSLDSPNVDSKRKERLNSCSSLPPNIGHKRRISSQDNFDSMCDEAKKNKNDPKLPERRTSKDSRSGDKHKTTKFSKGHFVKIIETKTKDDKKVYVKPTDNSFIDLKAIRKMAKDDISEIENNEHTGEEHNNLDFLALFELRSSEEDERQKALRKEMKEKKRIQQLQQIQELQMQQDAMQQGELIGKFKDDRKPKLEDKKKEAAREKRFSIDRKSRDEKNDNGKKKIRKQAESSDTSDSDEPKKHSIFDIIDDGPTYISMYDKVKARSCKNMQKQEEEKRQEKIKAKFSQLKQSRAKREEKKRSSWDEDSDSESDVHRKPQKSSIDNSSDEEGTHNKKRDKLQFSNIEFDDTKTEDFYSAANEDIRNKLARKNSRTRIISDSSDDDTSKSKSPGYINDTKKINMETMSIDKHDNAKNFDDQLKKNSLLNLFGKSDSDDSKLKSNNENDTDYKLPSYKSVFHDLSSESESVSSNRNTGEFRRKHKKKPKKHKPTYSDEESKIDHSDSGVPEIENRQKITERQRRHSSKKEKRTEKSRESIDTDEGRDDKIKQRREKRSPDNGGFEFAADIVSNSKRDGKMEDIFGPLSDVSDNDAIEPLNKSDISCPDFDSFKSRLSTELKLKEKDDARRKKQRRRKEKRWLSRDDDNSLDMDAVSKAIEARLFAESLTDDDNRILRMEASEVITREIHDKYTDNNVINDVSKLTSRHDKLRRDSREKKKKKKRNKEDRQNRKDNQYHHMESFEKSDTEVTERPIIESMTDSMLLDIPLPNDSLVVENKIDEGKSVLESPSLPRLTESPPFLLQSVQDIHVKSGTSSSSTTSNILGNDEMNAYIDNNAIEIEQIPMPPPIENIVQDISEVPLPTDPEPVKHTEIKADNFVATLSSDSDLSEDAILTTPVTETKIDRVEIDAGTDKMNDRVDFPSSKVEKKVEEKPRAIISQEETEDAVAALLGESFGGKIDAFSNYEEPESNTKHSNEIENTSLSTENIPEEDAEEMRQAVQNLNACEMEMKPDTPVSDNDLLLIDTDTEEADEIPQDNSEKQSISVPATNVSTPTNNVEPSKPTDDSIQVSITKSSLETLATKPHFTQGDVKAKETDAKIQLPGRENIEIITSSATPVITSWTLTNKKILEPHVINMHANISASKDKVDNKHAHLTTNILQIKNPQTQSVHINNIVKPILTPTRVSAPYQVVSHMVRPQTSNMQPPIIKIPEPHVLYQKPQGIVISPRLTNDPRIQSPKPSPQGDGVISPRLSTVPALTSPQSLSSSGMISPNSIHRRSPGQVTVVRVQHPPLSPIQAMHLPPGTMTMVSPNRPNSVLVQTQGSSLHHHNRLPVTPILTPIPKQMNALQQNKGVSVNNSPLLSQQKIITGDGRKTELRNISENKNENAKLIISPTSLQHSTNPTVMAQNRLISMQNAVHLGNINAPLHLNNKFVLNKMSSINEKREQAHQKVSECPFVSTPIIHVTGNHSSPSIIQSNAKSVVCNLQEASGINRGQGSNVIHTLNPQRLLAPVSLSNVRQLDVTKVPPSVLSMATIRPSTVLTKLESNKTTTAATSNVTNITPILIKSGATIGTIRITKPEKDTIQALSSVVQKETKPDDKINKNTLTAQDSEEFKSNTFALKPLQNSADANKAKCETDFEELLKDNTNKIIVAQDPEKKVESNIGNNTTILLTNVKNIERQTNSVNADHNFLVKEQNAPPSEQHSSESSFLNNIDDNFKDTADLNKNNSFKEICPVDSISPQETSTIISPIININSSAKESSSLELPQREQHSQPDPPLIIKTYENVSIDKEEPPIECVKFKNPEDIESKSHSESIENPLKSLDEQESWSAKDLNIESVIKKVDSLCNESIESIQTSYENKTPENKDLIMEPAEEAVVVTNQEIHPAYVNDEKRATFTDNVDANINNYTNVSFPKRGGRAARGKKNQDRVQTRQIAKTPRGTTTKRGRGRAKVDKKIKNVVSSNTSTMPGDVYEFHEDSGDEGSSNKKEPRPRLILTIKSPLSGQAGTAVATSTLSITQKDQNKFEERRPSKEEKLEDFVSPSPNTRKSRRLQEKDVHKSVADDAGEDGARNGRSTKRRAIKQSPVASNKSGTLQDKPLAVDTRKSPRGTKRTRDRSISDASIDSGDGEARKEENVRESKAPRLEELDVPLVEDRPAAAAALLALSPLTAALPAATLVSVASAIPSCSANVIISHVTTPIVVPAVVSQRTTLAAILQPSLIGPAYNAPPTAITATVAPSVAVAPAAAPPDTLPAPSHTPIITPPIVSVAAPPVAPTLITKPPKKMISEINAKLAGTYEAIVQHRVEPEVTRDPSPAAPATGEAQAGDVRRPGESAPCAMLPVGATEAADARVQSPALPHRLPLAQRSAADRPMPVLISHRGGDGEAGVVVGGVAAGGGAGARFRAVVGGGGGCGAASLPRGAHHPPPEPLPHAKPLPVAVVGPHRPHLQHHHHHSGAVSRITSVPSISPQGQMALGDGMYPHFSPQHFQMYQQHFRATQQETRATSSPFTRMEAEGTEAPASPLELRRLSARVPRPAHSPSPADRHIMYAVKCGRSPPPAHGGFVSRLAGALPPGAAGASGPPGPPHASQVPHEADSLQMLLRRYPVMWQGLLALKNDSAAVQMHFVGGNPGVASETLARPSELQTPLLRIAQRMRLEPMQLDQVHRKMKLENEHCILLALPCGRDHMDVLQQSTNLTAGFITYLQRKQAAGIVNIAPPGHQQAMFTVHIFPSCDFANENLSRIAPDLMHRVTNIAHLLIVIATV